jgi:predicted nucleic acid-binding protein
MTTAIDTNVIVALWDAEDSLHRLARAALDKVFNEGPLVITGAVYAELLAAPARTEEFLDRFCEDAQIEVEWDLSATIWKAARAAFQRYAARRRRQSGTASRRILADFVIGAHALVSGYRLLTPDAGLYKASFPKLEILTA